MLPKAIDEISNEDTSVLLCRAPSVEEMSCSESVQSTSRQGDGPPSKQQTSIRVGKGTHGLVTVRKLLEDKENWVILKNDANWQFPGVFSDTDKHEQCVLFIEDYRSVYPTCPKNLDFLWSDIQLSKGKVNNYKTSITIDRKDEQLFYKSAPCNGVKVCSEKGCHYVAPIRELRRCKNHSSKPLQKTSDMERCPVQFGYIYPVDHQRDHRSGY